MEKFEKYEQTEVANNFEQLSDALEKLTWRSCVVDIDNSILDELEEKAKSEEGFKDSPYERETLDKRRQWKKDNEEGKEMVKGMSPFERIKKLKQNFLDTLEKNEIELFGGSLGESSTSSDDSLVTKDGMGVFAKMYISGKSKLEYRVHAVVKTGENGEFLKAGDNHGQDFFVEEITLNEEQVKNFLNLLKYNIEEEKNDEDSSCDRIEAIEGYYEILSNGHTDKELSSPLSLSSEKWKKHVEEHGKQYGV
jgi:hypothetical protein